jgi:hypothetical protein
LSCADAVVGPQPPGDIASAVNAPSWSKQRGTGAESSSMIAGGGGLAAARHTGHGLAGHVRRCPHAAPGCRRRGRLAPGRVLRARHRNTQWYLEGFRATAGGLSISTRSALRPGPLPIHKGAMPSASRNGPQVSTVYMVPGRHKWAKTADPTGLL